MVLSRQLLVATRRHLHRKVLSIPTRRFSSSSSPSSISKNAKLPQLKKSGVARERRAAAVESFVKDYMQRHPGVFPKASQVQNEVGGSWYFLKDILSNLKEKVFGNPQSQHLSTKNSSDKMLEITTTEAIKTYTAEPDRLRSLQSSEKERDLHINEKDIITSSTSCINSVQLAEDGGGSHQSKASCSTVVAPDKDQEESLKQLSLRDGLVSKEENAAIATVSQTSVKNGAVTKVTTFIELNSSPVVPPDKDESLKQLSLFDGLVSKEENAAMASVSGMVGSSEEASVQLESKEGSEGKEMSTCAAVISPGRDREAALKPLSSLVGGLLSEEVNPTTALCIVGSKEKAATEVQDVSLKKKIWSCMTLKGTSEAKGMSSPDLLTRMNIDNRELDDNTSTQETSSDNSVKTSCDDSMKTLDIQSLIDRIKTIPKDSQPLRYHDSVSSYKINPLNTGRFPRHESQAAVAPRNLKHPNRNEKEASLSEMFTADKLNNYAQQEREINEPKETNRTDTKSQCKDRGTLTKSETLTKSDFSMTQMVTNLLYGDDPTMKVPFEIFNSQRANEYESRDGLGDASFDVKPKSSLNIPSPLSKASTEKKSDQSEHTDEARDQMILLVRFVRDGHREIDLEMEFKDCGSISEIRFVSPQKKRMFKDAYIRFKTKEGMQKALAKTDVLVRSSEVVLEAASLLPNKSSKLCAPSLISDPDVPTGLVKNPTRTVMIKELPCDVSLHHLKEALYGSGHISGFFMGSSSSVAYIEFETEDAKEKAIAASPISVFGRELPILRIDSPITTVIRISNAFVGAEKKNLQSVCDSLGKVRKIQPRGNGIYDVYFRVAEWPNMVNILNSINGKVVNDQRWTAQPATVIPCEILTYLWSQPDGKKQIYATIQDLYRKFVVLPFDPARLKSLVGQYCDEGA